MGMSGLIGGVGAGLPPGPAHDKFGLPLGWTMLSETKDQRTERFIAVVSLLREVHDAAVYQLGPRFANIAWKATSKGKPGRPKGRRKNADQDAEILQIYDTLWPVMDEKMRRSSRRLLAEYLKADRPHDFPISVSSIEVRIRRLLRHREAEQAAQAEANRKWATSLLESFNPYRLAPLSGTLNEAEGRNAAIEPLSGVRPRAAMDKKPP